MCNLWRLTCSQCNHLLQGPLTHCPHHIEDTNACPGETHAFHIPADVICQDCFAAPFKHKAGRIRASLSSMVMNLSTCTASEPSVKSCADEPGDRDTPKRSGPRAFIRPSLGLVQNSIAFLSSPWYERFISRLKHTFKPHRPSPSSLDQPRHRRRSPPTTHSTPSRHPPQTSKSKSHPLPNPAPDPSHDPKHQDSGMNAGADFANKGCSVGQTSPLESFTLRAAPSPSFFIRDTMNLTLTVCIAMISLSWTIYQPWRK